MIRSRGKFSYSFRGKSSSLLALNEIDAISQDWRKDFIVNPKEIGRGHFSKVFKVTCNTRAKSFAAKVIRRRRGGTDRIEKIRQEAGIVKKLNEKGIESVIKLFESHENFSEVVLILELANGGTLYQLVNESKHLIDQNYAKVIIYKLLLALEGLHSENIVHLDIKADNILLREPFPSTNIALCDFGLATQLQIGIRHKELVGTPDYMAPELVNYEAISLNSDMWSVGVLIYFLLTRMSPFMGNSKEETLTNVSKARITFHDILTKDYYKDAKSLIQLLCVKNPEFRLSSSSAQKHDWFFNINAFNTDYPLDVTNDNQTKSNTTRLISNDIDKNLLINNNGHRSPKISPNIRCQSIDMSNVFPNDSSSIFSNFNVDPNHGNFPPLRYQLSYENISFPPCDKEYNYIPQQNLAESFSISNNDIFLFNKDDYHQSVSNNNTPTGFTADNFVSLPSIDIANNFIDSSNVKTELLNYYDDDIFVRSIDEVEMCISPPNHIIDCNNNIDSVILPTECSADLENTLTNLSNDSSALDEKISRESCNYHTQYEMAINNDHELFNEELFQIQINLESKRFKEFRCTDHKQVVPDSHYSNDDEETTNSKFNHNDNLQLKSKRNSLNYNDNSDEPHKNNITNSIYDRIFVPSDNREIQTKTKMIEITSEYSNENDHEISDSIMSLSISNTNQISLHEEDEKQEIKVEEADDNLIWNKSNIVMEEIQTSKMNNRRNSDYFDTFDDIEQLRLSNCQNSFPDLDCKLTKSSHFLDFSKNSISETNSDVSDFSKPYEGNDDKPIMPISNEFRKNSNLNSNLTIKLNNIHVAILNESSDVEGDIFIDTCKTIESLFVANSSNYELQSSHRLTNMLPAMVVPLQNKDVPTDELEEYDVLAEEILQEVGTSVSSKRAVSHEPLDEMPDSYFSWFRKIDFCTIL